MRSRWSPWISMAPSRIVPPAPQRRLSSLRRASRAGPAPAARARPSPSCRRDRPSRETGARRRRSGRLGGAFGCGLPGFDASVASGALARRPRSRRADCCSPAQFTSPLDVVWRAICMSRLPKYAKNFLLQLDRLRWPGAALIDHRCRRSLGYQLRFQSSSARKKPSFCHDSHAGTSSSPSSAPR